MQKAIEFLEKNFSRDLEDLKSLVRIPSVSFAGFPHEEVKRSAQAVAELLKKRGLERVQILTTPGSRPDAHPYVYGERLRAPGKPTVLLYAHHDVQPPGREEVWTTPPFDPVVKPGPGGDRLYGRGAADDKAGIIVHTASIGAILETMGELPINVKVVIEGEEEVGSDHLYDFLKAYRPMLDADALVLTDCSNFDSGIPSLTTSLRGLVVLEVEVRSLTKTIHSGMWGGPIADPVLALSKMLGSLVDAEGKIQVPGVLEQVRPISPEEETQFKRIPYAESEFRIQSGMVPGSKIMEPNAARRSQLNPLVQTWRVPSLTVTAIQASSRKQASNIICDSAWARVTVRLVADMNPEKVAQALAAELRKQAPDWGLELSFKIEAANPPWSESVESLEGMVYAAAEKALEKGYGKAPLRIGTGGSIPFVGPFAEALGGVPALLVGVEDPYTNAHGENESLLISDLKKACLSQIHMFGELAEKWRSPK